MKPGSPVVEDLVGTSPDLHVHKKPIRLGSRLAYRAPIRHVRHHPALAALERPALAGVELLAPLPRPDEPPHFVVPVPAYPLDSIASAYLTPAPPVVCHRVRREPGLPDPDLYQERTIACQPDNP